MNNTVYAIDNGCDYDDHSIYLVEAEWPIEVINECLRIIGCIDTLGEKPYLVAIFKDPHWPLEVREVPERTTLEEILCHHIFYDGMLKPEATSLPKKLLEAAAKCYGIELKLPLDSESGGV